jgi:hypothetical protein
MPCMTHDGSRACATPPALATSLRLSRRKVQKAPATIDIDTTLLTEEREHCHGTLENFGRSSVCELLQAAFFFVDSEDQIGLNKGELEAMGHNYSTVYQYNCIAKFWLSRS